MFKKIFFLGLSAGIFSTVACIVYSRVYIFALGADFSKIINPASLMGINLLACLLAALGYWQIKRMSGTKAEIIFNISFTMVSFASIVVPFAKALPLSIQNPELFPGLAVPMHFYPALAWFTLKPWFFKERV
ncbi:MAG TPA: hypothetical protein VGZ71_02440 [Puia sp.]|nr:hypothetical protein [Puia sp.]